MSAFTPLFEPVFRALFRSAAESGPTIFSPLSMFANGEQGLWYDISDISSMFQDSTGTTPVTAVEQPVGFIKDKRLNFATGPQLVVNGDFSSGTASWTTSGTSPVFSVAGGVATIQNGTDEAGARQTFTVTAGTTYEVAIDVTGYAGGATGGRVILGGAPATFSGTGPKRFILTATGTGILGVLTGTVTPGHAVSFDNVSVRVLPGNHAIQPTAAARPVLSSRTNYLLDSATLNTTWSMTGATTPAADSFGYFKVTEDTSTGTHMTSRNTTLVASAGSQITAQMKVKSGGGRDRLRLQISPGASFGGTGPLISIDAATGVISGASATVASSSSTQIGPGEWLVTMTTVAATVTGGTFGILLGLNDNAGAVSYTGNGVSGGFFKDPQINIGTTATRYQRVTTATDYDTAGFPLYLRFDGVDDFLVTAANVDFSVRDEISAWCGITKLSDVASGIVFELSTDSGANDGSFRMQAPNQAAGNGAVWVSRGTVVASVASLGFPAPASVVLTGLADISADSATIRRDGIPSMTATDQGAGNYGSYPIYIGRRAGTSVPFNGQLNDLIILGRTATATEVAANEAKIAAGMAG